MVLDQTKYVLEVEDTVEAVHLDTVRDVAAEAVATLMEEATWKQVGAEVVDTALANVAAVDYHEAAAAAAAASAGDDCIRSDDGFLHLGAVVVLDNIDSKAGPRMEHYHRQRKKIGLRHLLGKYHLPQLPTCYKK